MYGVTNVHNPVNIRVTDNTFRRANRFNSGDVNKQPGISTQPAIIKLM